MRGLEKNCTQWHRHTSPHLHGHGDSMTNSAQWGRVGENHEKSKNPGGGRGSDRFWTKSILKLHFFSRASLTRHHALLSDRLQVLSRVRQLLPSARSLLPLLHIGPAGPALPVLHYAGCSRPGPVPLYWALWPAALLLLLAWVALNFPHHNQFIGN